MKKWRTTRRATKHETQSIQNPAGFKTRVRYEFNRLESNCTWSRPYQLAPAFREAERVDSLGLTHPIPASALPPEDWFPIDSIVADLRLTAIILRERVLAGYFVDSRVFER